MLVAGLALVLGCTTPARDEEARASWSHENRHTLTWRGYNPDDPHHEDAEYLFDGEPVGRGREGFKAVLEKLRDSAKHDELYIWPAYGMLKDIGKPSGPYHGLEVPFSHDDFRALIAMDQVATEAGIKVWYLAGPPGTLLADGEDMRIRGSMRGTDD